MGAPEPYTRRFKTKSLLLATYSNSYAKSRPIDHKPEIDPPPHDNRLNQQNPAPKFLFERKNSGFPPISRIGIAQSG